MCVCIYAFVHNLYLHSSVHMCSAEPEVAVIDCTALKQIQYNYWQRGRWGGRTPGSVRSTHSMGESLGHPTRMFWGF